MLNEALAKFHRFLAVVKFVVLKKVVQLAELPQRNHAELEIKVDVATTADQHRIGQGALEDTSVALRGGLCGLGLQDLLDDLAASTKAADRAKDAVLSDAVIAESAITLQLLAEVSPQAHLSPRLALALTLASALTLV